MFRLCSQLPRTPDAIKAHLQALRNVVLSEEHQDVFDHLYTCLSILDAKSSSMLAFNSIIIAVFAIFMTRQPASAELILLNVGMAAILVSAFLLLSVVWVHWSPTGDLEDPEKHGRRLLQVRNSRTVRYRIAWYLAMISLLSLAGFVVVRLFLGSA